MQCLEFKVGDDAWIAMGNDELSAGKVVHIFQLDWGGPHYVIELQTHIDPILEVRNGFTMSDAADKPIGMWRRNVIKQT